MVSAERHTKFQVTIVRLILDRALQVSATQLKEKFIMQTNFIQGKPTFTG